MAAPATSYYQTPPLPPNRSLLVTCVRGVWNFAFMPFFDIMDSDLTWFQRVRGCTIVPLLIIGVITLCVVGCGGGGKKDEGDAQQVKETKVADQNKKISIDQGPISNTPDIYNKPEVVGVRENNRRISESLTAVKERLDKNRLTLDEEKLTNKQIRQTLDLLIPLGDSACEDVDAIIRMAERIRFDLRTAEKGYRNIAELFRERGKGTADEVRSTYEQVAEHFDTLADDTPRRVKLTEEFLKDLQDARVKMADAARGLHDLKAAYSVPSPNSLDELKVSPEGQTFQQRIQSFLTAVRRYHESYFAGDPFRGTGEKK